jgi:hypothetical protein
MTSSPIGVSFSTPPADRLSTGLSRVSVSPTQPDMSARVLRSAAVIGREFDPELIGKAEQIENETVLDEIEPAAASSIEVIFALESP